MTVIPPPDYREEVDIVRIDHFFWNGNAIDMQVEVWLFS